MICSAPFKKVNNVGCVFLYFEIKHSQVEGLRHCKNLGGELFEFTNFDQQKEDVFNYLKANGGESLDSFLSYSVSHQIRFVNSEHK